MNNNVMLFRLGLTVTAFFFKRVFLPVHKKPLVVRLVCGQLLVSGLWLVVSALLGKKCSQFLGFLLLTKCPRMTKVN